MLSRHYAAEGRFTFTSHESGEHTICVGTNSTRWFGGNRLVSKEFNVVAYVGFHMHT